jgi:hypothetical protein
MTRYFGFFCLAFAWAAAAKDPNQPVSRGSAEFSGGASHARYTGSFDADGQYHSYPDSIAPSANIFPLRVRVGLGNGFELRSDWSYARTNRDFGSRQGMSQPSFSLRYVAKTLGVFSTVTLPFATGDFDNGNLNTALEVGGLLRLRSENIRFTSLLSYIDDFDENEILRIWMRPEVIWKPGFSTFISADYIKALGQDAWLSTLGPGLRVDFSNEWGAELSSPFSVAGRNSPIAGWSVSLRGLWTLKF